MGETPNGWNQSRENEWEALPDQQLEALFGAARERNRQRGEAGASYAFPRGVSEVHIIHLRAMDIYDERVLITQFYIPHESDTRTYSFQWSPSASITLPIDGWQYMISRSVTGICQLEAHPIFPEPDPDDSYLLGIQGQILVSSMSYAVDPRVSLAELLRGCTDQTLLPERAD